MGRLTTGVHPRDGVYRLLLLLPFFTHTPRIPSIFWWSALHGVPPQPAVSVPHRHPLRVSHPRDCGDRRSMSPRCPWHGGGAWEGGDWGPVWGSDARGPGRPRPEGRRGGGGGQGEGGRLLHMRWRAAPRGIDQLARREQQHGKKTRRRRRRRERGERRGHMTIGPVVLSVSRGVWRTVRSGRASFSRGRVHLLFGGPPPLRWSPFVGAATNNDHGGVEGRRGGGDGGGRGKKVIVVFCFASLPLFLSAVLQRRSISGVSAWVAVHRRVGTAKAQRRPEAVLFLPHRCRRRRGRRRKGRGGGGGKKRSARVDGL